MNLITVTQLSRELDKSRNTIVSRAETLKLNVTKGGDKKNAIILFTERQAQKIRESFKKRKP